MLVLAPYAKLIPMACLAGILIVVSYHMSGWQEFRVLLKGNGSDVMVLLVTFFLTVFFDLVIAIQIGIVLSSFVLMKRMSDSTTVQLKGSREELDGRSEEHTSELQSRGHLVCRLLLEKKKTIT